MPPPNPPTSPPLVYFRFEGDDDKTDPPPAGVHAVKTIDISFAREALKAFPNSVLTKLADDAWKKKKSDDDDDNNNNNNNNNKEDQIGLGETSDNPLISKPLEGCGIRDHWSPDLAQFIADTYLWKYHRDKNQKSKKNRQQQQDGAAEEGEQGEQREDDDRSSSFRPSLPVGVAIQDALVVLDYYGLDLLNYGEDDDAKVDLVDVINLERLSHEEQIRSKLFLTEIPLMEAAKEFVLQHLKENPARETLFVFVGKTDCMQAINHSRACTFKRAMGPTEFVRLGTLHDYHKHYGWIQDIDQRQMFLHTLQDTLPSLQIQYLNMDFTCDTRLQLSKPPEEFCWIETEESNDTNEDDGSGWILKRVVLSVKIPGKRTRTKTSGTARKRIRAS